VSGVEWVIAVIGALCLIAGIGAAIGLRLAEQVGDVLGEDRDCGTKDG